MSEIINLSKNYFEEEIKGIDIKAWSPDDYRRDWYNRLDYAVKEIVKEVSEFYWMIIFGGMSQRCNDYKKGVHWFNDIDLACFYRSENKHNGKSFNGEIETFYESEIEKNNNPEIGDDIETELLILKQFITPDYDEMLESLIYKFFTRKEPKICFLSGSFMPTISASFFSPEYIEKKLASFERKKFFNMLLNNGRGTDLWNSKDLAIERLNQRFIGEKRLLGELENILNDTFS